jgi:hypothetical protein
MRIARMSPIDLGQIRNRVSDISVSRLARAIPDRARMSARMRAKRRAMKDLSYEKILAIGGPKTGTQSLAEALKLLGFRHKGWDPELWDLYEERNYEPIFAVTARFESFDNGPWNGGDFYRELDTHFPVSKFILTIRETSSWSRSHERHFSAETGLRRIPARYWIHDYENRRSEFVREYEARNRDIVTYFGERPGKLLVIDVCRGEGWEKLCPFLGLSEPQIAFPRANPTARGS